MIVASLQISYRHGKPFAAYFYLPHEQKERVARSRRFTDDLVIDYAENGHAIGIEIVSPGFVTRAEVATLLQHLGLDANLIAEFEPVLADAAPIKATA